MKSVFSLAIAGIFALGIAHAENFTQKNADKARHIIELAVEAHGGDALLEELHTLFISNETTNHSVDQSRGTEPPWDTTRNHGYDAIDLQESVFVNRATGSGGGFENDSATIINGGESYQLNYRAGTVAEIAEPDFASASGPFVRVTPALLVRALKEREANAHYLGQVAADGEKFDVVGFSMTVGPAINLYFDDTSHMLRRSERVFPGFGLVEYQFDDYEDVDGVAFNREFTLFLNGDVNVERKITAIHVNKPIGRYTRVDERLAAIPAVEPDPLARYDVADGVWLIGGSGTYALFVDMGEYIVAAGGTGGIADRIELLREVVGDKPIRYGMLTHHHFDHVLGVSAYEAEGATVITASAHERIARRAAEDGEQLKVKTVDERMVLEGDGRRLEILDLGPTAHTEHLLVAYLPDEGLVFEADHFSLPQIGPPPPAVTSTRTFAEALARQDIRVERIASAHSPRIATMADLRQALEAELFQARR